MQLWQAAQKLGLENLLNFFVSKSACSMHSKISMEFDMSWSRVLKLQEITPFWDLKEYNLAFVEACLKCARIHPTLRPKSVQSGICWSIPQKCKNSPHFETQEYTIWHLLKPVSNVQEFTPLGNRKKWHVTLLLFLWHVNGSIKDSTNPSSFWQVCVQKNRMEINWI